MIVPLLLLLASCTDDDQQVTSPAAGLSVQPCPESRLGDHTATVSELLTNSHTWISVEHLEITSASEMPNLEESLREPLGTYQTETPFVLHSIEGQLHVGNAIPSQALAQREVAAGINEWLSEPEGTLFLGFTEYVTYGVLAQGNGLSFVGSCYEALMNPKLEELLSRSAESGEPGDRSGLERFESWLKDRGQDLKQLEDEIVDEGLPTPWSERDPQTRTVDDSVVPPDELARLERVLFILTLTEPITDGDRAVICPRTAVGWSPCISLAVWDEGRPLIGEVYGNIDDTVEVWILNDPPDVESPVTLLGKVDLIPDANIQVTIDGGATIESLVDPELAGDYVTIQLQR